MHLPLLATTCLLLSAKLQEPVSPCFERMICNLLNDERLSVTKELIVNLESHILITLGFDFNFTNPLHPMERFLRVLNYHQNQVVKDISFQILKFQLNDSSFLQYKQSILAACSVILAINIYEK